LRITAGIEEPTLVYYDRKNHDVDGGDHRQHGQVDGAKREIDAIVDVIGPYVLDYAKRQHSIDLTESDVTLIYYVDSDQGVPRKWSGARMGSSSCRSRGAREKD